ncbi:diadenylate cyclase CdaA [Pigmentibacter sp. JX0631]|uniref:diadenylate cyclase CdaA n=1 Tax=Pigmentibacter sp. JX0631 TaxID=2976982 RepID=UPI002468AC32|nr:diadenylate cyclase CdaA [Pigmentibacter sp. JX0631]WGL60578.1 diadenylate cyclase CdaA [Pigmentibacter sp. JX0631]
MNYLESIKSIISWKAFIDISLVAFLLYQIISMLKGTRAAQVLIGMLVIFITYVFSSMLQFDTLHWIISKFYSSFIIVVIVLFQDDIRRLLTRFGRGPFATGLDSVSGTNIIEEITNAAKSLSHERIGALIVFERSVGLDKLYDHSIMLDAVVSEQLLSSIFQSFSPLHDGAVIIKKDRINCASAQLPLSKNPRFSKKMGTRHSAAVGISEETDAVVLVVSEETGNISIAWEGNLQRQSSSEAARKMLSILLLPRGQNSKIMYWFENFVIFKIHKIYVKSKSFINSPFNKNYKKSDKQLQRKVSSLETLAMQQAELSMQQVEYENKIASNIPSNIHIRFPRSSKIKDIKSNDMQFISSNILSKNQNLNITQNINENISEDDNDIIENDDNKNKNGSEKNKALKAITEIAPEDRFDPPIPKSPPPRDVSIGGIPLDPPIEKNKKDEEKTKKEVTNGNDKKQKDEVK